MMIITSHSSFSKCFFHHSKYDCNIPSGRISVISLSTLGKTKAGQEYYLLIAGICSLPELLKHRFFPAFSLVQRLFAKPLHKQASRKERKVIKLQSKQEDLHQGCFITSRDLWVAQLLSVLTQIMLFSPYNKQRIINVGLLPRQ